MPPILVHNKRNMPERAKFGAVTTGLITVAALCAIGFVFISNASPYVTIAEAKSAKGTDLHVAGVIDQSTVDTSSPRKISFVMEDDTHNKMPVMYEGEAIANIGEAKQVVVIGHMGNGVFDANKMLIKCQSKYSDGKTAAAEAAAAPKASGSAQNS